MIDRRIGKVQKVRYGNGVGYQDAMTGIQFTLGSAGWGVIDSWAAWTTYSEGASYSKEEWMLQHGKVTLRIADLLLQAKVDQVVDLKDIPVEVTFDGGILKSWRVLTEVL